MRTPFKFFNTTPPLPYTYYRDTQEQPTMDASPQASPHDSPQAIAAITLETMT